MHLLRRVPWVHYGELEQICLWIFTGEDTEAKTQAVHRVLVPQSQAWFSHHWTSYLPEKPSLCFPKTRIHFGDSGRMSSGCTTANWAALVQLNLRQAYASALIRMVKVGRSIPSRGEDLPSLELLRDAAREVQ